MTGTVCMYVCLIMYVCMSGNICMYVFICLCTYVWMDGKMERWIYMSVSTTLSVSMSTSKESTATLSNECSRSNTQYEVSSTSNYTF